MGFWEYELLEALGAEQWHRDAIGNRAPLFFFIATGVTEQKNLHLWEKRRQAVKQEPVLLLTHSANNALPGAMEVLARLKQDGEKGRILFFHGPKDASRMQELARAIRDLEVLHDLWHAKIGLIGGRSMNQLWLAEGEILQAGDAEDLCRTQVLVRLSGEVGVMEILLAPLGNHLVLIYGHHAEHMRRWWKDMISD